MANDMKGMRLEDALGADHGLAWLVCIGGSDPAQVKEMAKIFQDELRAMKSQLANLAWPSPPAE